MIFYFSCTGNTRWAAEKLAKATGERLIWMGDDNNATSEITLKEDERVGFCFPVHGWRPPKNVRDFCRRLHFSNPQGHYAFALCTAGDNIGETMRLLHEDLKESGLQIKAHCSLIMPESYVGLPFMDVDKPKKERQKIVTASKDLKIFIDVVLFRRAIDHNLVIGHWPRINTRLIGSYFVSRLVNDKPFRVDETACIGCGMCQKVCPSGDLVLDTESHPQWKHNGKCLTCFACYHHCPQHAIAFGHRTDGKGQYYFQPPKNE